MPVTPPIVSVLWRRPKDLLLGWDQIPRKDVKFYKVYSAPIPAGPYVFLKNVQNTKDTTYGYKMRVVCPIMDAEIPIVNANLVRYYFKVTYVDPSLIESNIALSPTVEIFPTQVEPFWENEDEPRNEHGFAWVESRQRWEKIQLTDDGKLKTDADVNIGSITLGNVKVAEKPDNVTLDYILIDNNRKLIVRIDQDSISRIAHYEETINIIKNVETTILTYTNALAYFVEKVVCSSTGDAVFKLKIDGTTIRTLRNAWNDRNVTFDFSTIARKIPSTSVVTITAIHTEKTLRDYEASLEGFTFTI